MDIDIQLIEIAGEHYVAVIIDGRETRRHGPFAGADTAAAAAAPLLRFGRALTKGGARWAPS
jgi:hypothetical protein